MPCTSQLKVLSHPSARAGSLSRSLVLRPKGVILVYCFHHNKQIQNTYASNIDSILRAFTGFECTRLVNEQRFNIILAGHIKHLCSVRPFDLTRFHIPINFVLETYVGTFNQFNCYLQPGNHSLKSVSKGKICIFHNKTRWGLCMSNSKIEQRSKWASVTTSGWSYNHDAVSQHWNVGNYITNGWRNRAGS